MTEPTLRGEVATIAPNLVVPDGVAAIAFYRRAFGAVVLHQVDPDAGVAELAVEGAPFWISAPGPEIGRYLPAVLPGHSVAMILTVADPDAVWAAAVAAGATPESEMADEHGWRLGRVVDPFGHHWEIGRPTAPWPPG
jgi:PhnB protein